MITFDDLRINDNNPTMDLFAGMQFINRVSMIDGTIGPAAILLQQVISGSWASASTSDGFTEITGSGAMRVANIEGATVINFAALPEDTGIWLVSTTSGSEIGVTLTGTTVTFSTGTSIKQKFNVAPNFTIPFTLAYMLELDSDMAVVFQTIALYNGDKLLATCVFDVGVGVYADYVKLVCDSTKTFSLLIYELCRPVTYLTIDVSESPQEALARLTNGLPVEYSGRYDGTMLARKSGISRDAVFDLSGYHNLASAIMEQTNHTGVVNRARVAGALPEGEVVDLHMADMYLLRFAVYQNPEIMSQADAKAEAARLLRRNYRDTHTLSMNWHALPVFEAGDVVLVSGVRYVFVGGAFNFAVGIFGNINLSKESY